MLRREKNYELEEIAKGLFDTFVHRRSAFTVQTDDGRYFANYHDITVKHIMEHLKGDITIGLYLLGEDETAKYSVIDADDEGGLQQLTWVKEMLGLPSYLESSRRGGALVVFLRRAGQRKNCKKLRA